MSANLYATKDPETFFHIHGSLEASTTLNMIGLPPFRPDLKTIEEISDTIESHVKQYTIEELERMNKEQKQAGVTVFKYADFIKTPHVLPLFFNPFLNSQINNPREQSTFNCLHGA
jgi:hypothetical protein